MRRRVAGASFIGAIAAGIVVAATQAPLPPRLIGAAAPPAEALSLWYQTPASDHPLLPLDAPRQSRQAGTAEWVRALPVGNGRIGAMVFGGVVHERLQLNEDTLWAGRPYDPVNPDAKDALPEVRRLLAERKYPEAAKLVDAKVMSKPLGQMPYETVGDLALTFPEVDSAENYRRDLDLTTATAHVTFTSGGVTFSREVFASAPDQVIAVRLTASRPGQISFEARMQTPQRATVEATADGDLVMRGVNGEGVGTTADGRPMTGALRFEARVRVVTSGGTRSANGRRRGRSRRRRRYVAHRGGDQLSDRRRRRRRSRGACRGGARSGLAQEHRHAARRARPRLPAAVQPRHARSRSLDSSVPTDERVRAFADGDDPGACGALLPVRPLPADCQLAQRVPAGEPAGPVERKHVASLGQQVHHQHQHRDELLAGALDQPGRDDGSVDGDWCRTCR